MEPVVRTRFRDPELATKLLATGDRERIEGNTWRNYTWSCVQGTEGTWKGQNRLGKIRMPVREELRGDEQGERTI